MIVVAQSFGGYVAPIVAERIDARLIVLVAGDDPVARRIGRGDVREHGLGARAPRGLEQPAVFYHDVPPELADEALSRGRRQSDTPGREPWPLAAMARHPDAGSSCAGTTGSSRRDGSRPLVRDRLGIEPDEIDSGHCPALSRPGDLAELLDGYWNEAASPSISAASG